MVCDNLSFIGEVRISRKHTRFATRDLRHLTARAVGQLGDRFSDLDARIAAYRSRRLSDEQAHDAIVKSLDCRALVATQVPEEWRAGLKSKSLLWSVLVADSSIESL